jgi:addiction module antitoxin, relB/dinJ family
MDLSTATGVFYKQALRYYGLPFEIKVDDPNGTTYEAIKSTKNNEEIYEQFDMVKYLVSTLDA